MTPPPSYGSPDPVLAALSAGIRGFWRSMRRSDLGDAEYMDALEAELATRRHVPDEPPLPDSGRLVSWIAAEIVADPISRRALRLALGLPVEDLSMPEMPDPEGPSSEGPSVDPALVPNSPGDEDMEPGETTADEPAGSSIAGDDLVPARFRKKPVVIEAMRYDRNEMKIAAWMGNACHGCYSHPDGFAIPTREGTMVANPGDWVIKGVKGEFYPCKPDIFSVIYEPVSLDEAEDLPPRPTSVL